MKKILFPVLIALLLGAVAAGAQPYENSSVVGEVPDRVLVTVKSGVDLVVNKASGTPAVGIPAMDALAERFSVNNMEGLYAGMTKNLAKSSQDELARVWAVDFSADHSLATVEAAYKNLPEVEKVERVAICKMYDAYLPDDPGLGQQWYVRNMNLGGGDVRAVGAWSETLGDTNVVVCVLDSGVDWHHPDLGGPHPDKVNGSIWTNWPEYYGTVGVDDDGNGKLDDIRGWDFVNTSQSDGWPDEDMIGADGDPMDYGSHGTNCAGTIAAISNNGIGITGIAPKVKVMAVRCGYMPNGETQGVVRMDWAAAGIVYAANTGANVINCSWGSHSSLSTAVTTAQFAGVLLVTAAGNDSADEPSYLSTRGGVISVAATNSSDGRSDFSNFGDWVEISAPGSAIYTTSYVVATDSHSYGSTQGTSFSSPITAAAAAMVWSAMPELTATEVAQVLYDSADDLDALNPGFEGKLGAGRVNLLRALGDNVHRFPQEFPTLYDALNSAAAGDTIAVPGDEVIAGPLSIPGKDLKVLGGYSADFTSRDPVGNPTAIVGQINNNVLKFSGAVDNNTVVDGFHISGGGGNFFGSIPYSGDFGGGVMLIRTSPTLRNLEITGNSVGSNSVLGCGGGLMMSESSAVLENVYIHDNTAIYGGGLCIAESTPTLIDCVIENNEAILTNPTYDPKGGGLHIVDSDVTMIDCTVSGHLEQIEGGGVFLTGFDATSSLDMTGGEISGNSAQDFGGGLYINGGSLSARGVLIDGNTKTASSVFMQGGGIFTMDATVSLDSLTCINNVANTGGGMELTFGPEVSVTNSLVANNDGRFWGGGISFADNTAGTISGNTVTGNNSQSGGAGIYVFNATPDITNNISAFNTGGGSNANGIALDGVPASLACNDVFGNDGDNYSGQPDPTGTDGNISVDPLFCDAANGDYGIATASPCAAANSGGCGLIGAFTGGSCGVSAVPEEGEGVPMVFRVEQNYPNPFNPKTTIKFALPTAGPTQVNVFDVAGRHVRTLLDEDLVASSHEVTWSGDDDQGRGVSAGVYFYMVTSGVNRSVGRMALIK